MTSTPKTFPLVDSLTQVNVADNITEASTGDYTPAQDLYRSVNGTWLATHEIPADRPVDGTFHALRDQSEEEVHTIVTNAPTDSRIGALYTSFMDTDGIERAGTDPLATDINPVLAIDDAESLATMLGKLDVVGVSGPLALGVDKDTHSDTDRVWLYQFGLGLPDEAYYREKQHAGVVELYKKFITDFLPLVNTGWIEDLGYDLPGAVDAIYDFESQLAKGQWDIVDSRDSQKTNNPTPAADLPTSFPVTTWLKAVGIDTDGPAGEVILVQQPSYLDHLGGLVESTPLNQWKLWMIWKIVTSRASILTPEISGASFKFYGTALSGTEQQRDRWKRAVGLVDSLLGEDIGRAFVSEHFPETYKEDMNTLVDYLLDAYRERISQLDWMTPDTISQAQSKLGTFRAKIGYPDSWRDYSDRSFSPKGEDLVDNVRKGTTAEHYYHVSTAGKPTDRDRWVTTPQTVNAFYHPVKNDITFPAAILRPPFFDADADIATNLGAIGAVIGHEIGHGFDDQGSQYDGLGNLNSWWSDEDRAAFVRLTAQLVAQFEGLTPTGLAQRGITDHTVNGQFTLGENIGDLGGLGIAVVALQRYILDPDNPPLEQTIEVEGFGPATPLQRLFLSWATVWQTAIRPELSAQYTAMDPHSPSEFRCNVIAANIPEFYEAFGVGEDDPMFIPEDQRVQIW